MSGPDRVDLFRADIATSGAALASLLDTWSPVDLGGRRRIAAFGLGSSRFAAMVATSAARAGGADAWAEYAGPDVGPPPADELVAVCISASGGTREVLEVAGRHRGRSLVVAVTNDPSSPLAERADIVLPLHAGIEASGIACRTYRATLAVLGLLLGVTDLPTLRGAIAAIDALGPRGADADAVEALDGAPLIDVVAPGPLLGAAEQAALMLREAPRLPAHAVETADWSHTHVYLALPGHRVLLLPGSHDDEALRAIVERRGGRVLDLPAVDGGPIASAIVTSLRVERLAAELWARTDADAAAPG
jgi:glucosamine--fructose-6-phosphate aminotransferase (isomerizing)